MSAIKPRPIRSGATFGIVSPASTPRPELVARGVEVLAGMGYRSKVFPSALTRGPLYYAGAAEERVADLHAAFADPEIDAILCTRGGWGSAELLPLLDRKLIRLHIKPFLGYSDQTSLHIWLAQETEMVTFHAPMLAADLSKPSGVDLASWNAAFSVEETWSFGVAEGLRVLREGHAEGTVAGGCLAIYAESLGTPYSAKPHNGLLFLEDIGVKPYQWDRMLVHLRQAGMLDRVTGIIFGDMAQCGTAEDQLAIEASLMHSLKEFRGPIAIGLRSGHVTRENITLPFGIPARLDLRDAENPQMHFLEPAVQR